MHHDQEDNETKMFLRVNRFAAFGRAVL